MHGRFTQHSAARQKCAIEHEQVRDDCQNKICADQISISFLYQQCVEQRHGDDPGNERRIFHWIPSPISTPTKNAVCPIGTEHDAQAKNHSGKENPRHSADHPAIIFSAPQCRHGKTELYRHHCKSDEQYRRMDHHPKILKQRIESLAIRRNHAGTELPGECIPDRLERRPGEEQHHKKRLRQHEERENVRFKISGFGVPEQYHTQDSRTECPEEKTSFLSRIESRK